MFTPRPLRRLQWSAVGGVGFLLLSALVVILGGRAAEGRTASAQNAAAVESAPAEPVEAEPPTTISPATTTTTVPPTTTTTVRQPIPTTVAVVRTTVAAPVVAEAAAAPARSTDDQWNVAVAAPDPSASPAERCAAAQRWVEAHGLVLPAGYGFRCPAPALQGDTARWGITCWNCTGTGSWIAIDIDRIGSSDAALRYVIAHETCHAIDFATLGLSTEIGADLCAALHGAPRP